MTPPVLALVMGVLFFVGAVVGILSGEEPRIELTSPAGDGWKTDSVPHGTRISCEGEWWFIPGVARCMPAPTRPR